MVMVTMKVNPTRVIVVVVVTRKKSRHILEWSSLLGTLRRRAIMGKVHIKAHTLLPILLSIQIRRIILKRFTKMEVKRDMRCMTMKRMHSMEMLTIAMDPLFQK